MSAAEISAAREVLRGAIDAHRTAAEATQAALNDVDEAKGFVRGLEAQLQGFADLDAKIARDRAAMMKAAIANGLRPTMEVSPELAKSAADRLEAKNQLDAARQAAASLAWDHALAQKAEAARKQDVEEAAKDVVAAEVAEAVERLKRAQADVLKLAAVVMTADQVWFGGGNIWRGQRGAIIRAGLEAVHAPAPNDMLTTFNSEAERHLKKVRVAFSDYLMRLVTDADAALGLDAG